MAKTGRPNYFGMKDENFIATMEAEGIEIVYNENGAINKKETVAKLNQIKHPMDYLSEDTKKKVKAKTSKEGDFVKIMFHAQEGATKYVFVGVNGKSYYLPREKKLSISKAVFEAVKNAVQIKLEQIKDKDGIPRYYEKRVPRFSYEVFI